MADGILNTAQIMDTVTELRQSLDLYNQQDKQWDALLCMRTHKETERVYQRSMSYRPVAEGATPERQRLDYQDIALPIPMRYGLGAAVTQQAMEDGLDRQTIETQYQQALDADKRWVTLVIMRAMMLDGGWWDATATPPKWQGNSFASSHDHYPAYNVSGIPTLAHFTAIERTIQEHGFGLEQDGGVIAVINGATARNIVNLAEWATAPGPMPTSTMDTLQRLGLTASFRAGGVLVTKSDWVPEHYCMAWAANQMPLHWRMPRGMNLNAGILTSYDPANVRTFVNFDFWRRGSAKVTLRGAGCAAYFNSASWTDPTINLTD